MNPSMLYTRGRSEHFAVTDIFIHSSVHAFRPKINIREIKLEYIKKRQLGAMCSICLLLFKLRQHVRVLQCSHFYHPDCLKQWLINSRHCPTCRTFIQPRTVHTIDNRVLRSATTRATRRSRTTGPFRLQGRQASFVAVRNYLNQIFSIDSRRVDTRYMLEDAVGGDYLSSSVRNHGSHEVLVGANAVLTAEDNRPTEPTIILATSNRNQNISIIRRSEITVAQHSGRVERNSSRVLTRHRRVARNRTIGENILATGNDVSNQAVRRTRSGAQY